MSTYRLVIRQSMFKYYLDTWRYNNKISSVRITKDYADRLVSTGRAER